MADPLSKSDAVLVVTLRTLLSADGVELPDPTPTRLFEVSTVRTLVPAAFCRL